MHESLIETAVEENSVPKEPLLGWRIGGLSFPWSLLHPSTPSWRVRWGSMQREGNGTSMKERGKRGRVPLSLHAFFGGRANETWREEREGPKRKCSVVGRDRKSFGRRRRRRRRREEDRGISAGAKGGRRGRAADALLLCRGTISSEWFAVYLYSTYRRKKKAEDGRSAKVNTGVDGPSLPLLRSMETGEN